MDIKTLVKEAFAEMKLSSGDASQIGELTTKLAAVTTERDGLKTQVDQLTAQLASAASPFAASLTAAGIDSEEKLAAKLASADAYDAQVAAQRAEAETRLTALYADKPAELAAEKELLASLPAGAVLDRQLARINAEHDQKFGTQPGAPAARVSAPAATAKVALDAASAPKVELSPEQKKLAAEEARASF